MPYDTAADSLSKNIFVRTYSLKYHLSIHLISKKLKIKGIFYLKLSHIFIRHVSLLTLIAFKFETKKLHVYHMCI